MREYSVYFENRVVGKARFSKEGMYQRVKCTCKIPKDLCCDAFIKTSDALIPLGILVPVADGMGTEKRVHLKMLTGEVTSLCLLIRVSSSSGIPVEPEKPFPHIYKIKNLKVITDIASGRIRLVVI